ncbi:MAG TPA: hypothetical protein VMB48_01230 [Steroidobacteraceae bacterium]|nr:hypothetical protein [Steroidobacteraceae bacterium]
MNDLPRSALSEDEVNEILRAGGEIAILVGGQALAVWASFYRVEIPAALSGNVTRDADFIGTKDTALIIKAALSNQDWTFEPVRAGSLSPVVAQLVLRSDDGIKEIDFLGSIVGLRTHEVRRRAVPVCLPDGSVVTVLHPLDVLASRLHNLAELPEKRTAKGVAQAQLAIGIAGAFLRDTIARGQERDVYNQIERMRLIVTHPAIATICREYGLDVLAGVPLEQIRNENFRARRWPQIQREVAEAVGPGAALGDEGR